MKSRGILGSVRRKGQQLGIVYLLLPVSLLLAAAFVLAFRWAAHGGQFDELDTEAARILFDDDRATGPEKDRTR